MRVLIDTNVLLRMGDEDNQDHRFAMRAVERLLSDKFECILVPQVLYEYWVVATRPVANNGFGFSPAETAQEIDKWSRHSGFSTMNVACTRSGGSSLKTSASRSVTFQVSINSSRVGSWQFTPGTSSIQPISRYGRSPVAGA